MEATVVIPTKNRPRELVACLRALAAQDSSYEFEVVVIDDGSDPSVDLDAVLAEVGPRPAWAAIRLLRAPAIGPAGARNVGVAQALGEVILFTDDDTVPHSGWVAATCGHLSVCTQDVAVEGETDSPPFDPLFSHSVTGGAGSWLTCNIAYRAAVLRSLGGFCEAYPYPHAEDLDLAYRARQLGGIGFQPNMKVSHPPRPISLVDSIRKGRFMASDVELMYRHPADLAYRRMGSIPASIVLGSARNAFRWLRAEWPRRAGDRAWLARFAAVVTGQLAIGVFYAFRQAARVQRRRTCGAPVRKLARR